MKLPVLGNNLKANALFSPRLWTTKVTDHPAHKHHTKSLESHGPGFEDIADVQTCTALVRVKNAQHATPECGISSCDTLSPSLIIQWQVVKRIHVSRELGDKGNHTKLCKVTRRVFVEPLFLSCKTCHFLGGFSEPCAVPTTLMIFIIFFFIMSSCHHVIMSSCHHVIMSSCHHNHHQHHHRHDHLRHRHPLTREVGGHPKP
eukprot:171189-Amphidinium_carterae.1